MKNHTSITDKQLARLCAPFRKLPVWHGWKGYGTFVCLLAGKPSIETMDMGNKMRGFVDLPGVQIPARFASLTSNRILLFEAETWSAWYQNHCLFHSESQDAQIARGLRYLRGHCLEKIEFESKENQYWIRFDTGIFFKLSGGYGDEIDGPVFTTIIGQRVTSVCNDNTIRTSLEKRTHQQNMTFP